MKSTEKNREKLSYSRAKTANAKVSGGRRFRIKPSEVQDYIDYMEDIYFSSDR